jgi:SHS2 domain-containing protein
MSYRWGEHVGELELCLEAETEHAVFADALQACHELLAGDEDRAADCERFEVAASGGDRALLLAGWIEELSYLAEADGVIPVALDELELTEGRLRARIAGYRGDPPHLVKAVTYHRLSFEPHDGGWRATVILDV